MKNEYEIRGDVTAILLNSPKHGKMETIISTKNLSIAQSYNGKWYPRLSKNGFYCVGSVVEDKRKRMVLLHRQLTGAPDGMVVDHINHNTMDNSDENLRVLTQAENNQNASGRGSIRGVNWDKNTQKWRARLRVNGVDISAGYFDSMEEAHEVVREARKRHMPFSVETL